MDSMHKNRGVQLLRVVVTVMLLGGFVLIGRPAHAEPIPGTRGPTPAASPFTELQVGQITGELGVSDVDAFDAPLDTFNPLEGYPAATDIPATWDAHNLGYAGIIPAFDNEGNQVLTYCIDLFTSTQTGVTYERDDWTEANVRNIGYVAHILQNYYPAEPDQPAGVANNVRAAAVQAAIWFFSDNLVVNPTLEPQLYALTSAIVADAIENGPVPEPQPPSLDVSPSSALGPSTGELVGPFTVTADGPSILRLQGVEVFTDAAGTQQLAEGDTVAPGAQLWVRSTTAGPDQGFALQRLQTIRESTVYLYDGADPNRQTAQKLILARDTELEAVAGVRVTQFAAGGLQVTKTIGGEAAGLQGALEIRVVCTPPDEEGDPIERTITIPARAPAGAQPPTAVTGVPAGSTCVITEPDNGDNQRVNVTATAIEPETVTIVENETAAVAVTNDYELARGGLQVTKRIGGPAAGAQGEIVLVLDCDDAGDAFDQELTVPAGTVAGEYPVATVTGIPVGTECTVTETDTGVTDTILLDTPTIVSPASVTIDEETSEVTVTNNYREEENGGDDDNGGDNGNGGGGGGGGDEYLGGGASYLPEAGAPNESVPLLPLGIALVAAGSILLFTERRLANRRI